jgi:biopolymer transport protein ExbD
MKERVPKEMANINIIPSLNLFSGFLPFLMLVAVMAEVSILDLNLPTPGTGLQGEAPETEPLMLTIIISDEGFTVGASGGFLDSILKNPDGSYNYEKLMEQLKQVGESYPDNTEVIIASELAVKYQEIIHVMDAARANGLVDISLSGLHGDGT